MQKKVPRYNCTRITSGNW